VARQLAPDPMRSVRDRARFGTKGRRLDFWELHKRLHTHRILELVQAERKRKAAICTAFVEPSDGLEPSTPSLPWRFRSVTRVHARSPKAQFLLQIPADPGVRDASQGVARVVSDVSVLCPWLVVCSYNREHRVRMRLMTTMNFCLLIVRVRAAAPAITVRRRWCYGGGVTGTGTRARGVTAGPGRASWRAVRAGT
jgi:hypothetical protein